MSFWDRLLGREPRQPRLGRRADRRRLADEQAIERYRYLLRTAPPETIEQAHAEAFAQLTPAQRQMVLQELSGELPPGERAAAMRAGDDPRALARTVTRAEMRNPGTLERRFGGMGTPGLSMGGLMAGSFLSTIAGVVVGSAIADAFFSDAGYEMGGDAGSEALAETDGGGYDDTGEAGGDVGSPAGDFTDLGAGDFGDFGGDF